MKEDMWTVPKDMWTVPKDMWTVPKDMWTVPEEDFADFTTTPSAILQNYIKFQKHNFEITVDPKFHYSQHSCVNLIWIKIGRFSSIINYRRASVI